MCLHLDKPDGAAPHPGGTVGTIPGHPAGGLQVPWLSSVYVYTLKCGSLLLVCQWIVWKMSLCFSPAFSCGCSSRVAVACWMRLHFPGPGRRDFGATHRVCLQVIARACNPAWNGHGAGFVVWLLGWFIWLIVGPGSGLGASYEKVPSVDGCSFDWLVVIEKLCGCVWPVRAELMPVGYGGGPESV